MRCAFVTFGCKVNQYETQAIRERMLSAGHEEVAGEADIYIVNVCSVTSQGVAKARRLLHGHKTGLVIVDYLQLMQPQTRRSENRQVEIADISRGLKVLAKELDVPVLALSQLSRAVEQRTGKRPAAAPFEPGRRSCKAPR